MISELIAEEFQQFSVIYFVPLGVLKLCISISGLDYVLLADFSDKGFEKAALATSVFRIF